MSNKLKNYLYRKYAATITKADLDPLLPDSSIWRTLGNVVGHQPISHKAGVAQALLEAQGEDPNNTSTLLTSPQLTTIGGTLAGAIPGAIAGANIGKNLLKNVKGTAKERDFFKTVGAVYGGFGGAGLGALGGSFLTNYIRNKKMQKIKENAIGKPLNTDAITINNTALTPSSHRIQAAKALLKLKLKNPDAFYDLIAENDALSTPVTSAGLGYVGGFIPIAGAAAQPAAWVYDSHKARKTINAVNKLLKD